MIEEVRVSDYGEGEENSGGDEDRVSEWVNGLPGEDDLTPLSQSLVPPILALAFMITPERSRTIQDVNRAARNTVSSSGSNGSSGVVNASSSNTAVAVEEMDLVESSSPGSDPKKFDGGEGEDSVAEEGDSESEDPCGKTLKRPRLVWTPKLHKRFVDVVTHLGVRNAVPKTIMQLMNVNGLTRENVASHLQKYRLYLKRIQGSTTEDLSSSDQLFSVPPQSFQKGGIGDAGTGNLRIPAPAVMPMQGYYNNGHYQQHRQHGNGVFESNPYMMQQNKFGFKSTSSSLGGDGVNDK